MPYSRGSSQPRDEPRSPAWQVDSLLTGPPGKPKNTGAAGLPVLQGIFPAQDSDWDLLLCRRIPQLSYQGSTQPQVISP